MPNNKRRTKLGEMFFEDHITRCSRMQQHLRHLSWFIHLTRYTQRNLSSETRCSLLPVHQKKNAVAGFCVQPPRR